MVTEKDLWLEAGRILDERMSTVSHAKFGEDSDVIYVPREDNVRALMYGDLIDCAMLERYSVKQAYNIVQLMAATDLPHVGLVTAAIEGGVAMGIKFAELRADHDEKGHPVARGGE